MQLSGLLEENSVHIQNLEHMLIHSSRSLILVRLEGLYKTEGKHTLMSLLNSPHKLMMREQLSIIAVLGA